jgi:iron complex transport system ATP-binding protein
MNEQNHPILELKEASIGYHGKFPLLPRTSWVWKPGGIHLLLGRNGAGKSTMIRTLAGLMHPLNGEVRIAEESVYALSSKERARRLAFVHSTPPRTSELRVGEVLQLHGVDETAVRDVLLEFGEESWWERPLSNLSDGEAQRVMFARCMLQQTDWILLDEPTAFLDALARRRFWNFLEKAAQLGRGILVATHDFAELDERLIASVTLVSHVGLKALDPTQNPTDWTSEMG